MAQQKITQAFVDGLPFEDSGTAWFHDTELAGFNLAVGKRSKAKRRADELTVGQVWEMCEAHRRASILEEQGEAKARRAEGHLTRQRRYLGGAERYGRDGHYASSLAHPKGWWDRPSWTSRPRRSRRHGAC